MGMKTFFKILGALFMGLGVSFFILIVLAGMLINQHMNAAPKKHMPDQATLTLTIAQPMVENVPPLVRELAGDQAPPSLEEFLAALELAQNDPHIKGVYIRAVGGSVTLTQAEELRGAIARVREAKKTVIFFTDTFGEMDNGTAMIYLSAAADKIILQPGGFAGFTGIAMQQPFFRGLLDRYGILPEFEKRRAYKNAMDNLTETQITDASRTEYTRLLTGLSDNVVNAVAKDRKISPEEVMALRDQSPLPADMAGKLIDAVQYEDEIQLPAEKISMLDYFSNLPSGEVKNTAPKIALVDASGEIMRGPGQPAGAFSSEMIGAEDFIKALSELQENKEVNAVIIRLNSPGGSAIASETIYHAIERLKASGKPVIISMTDVAASGGYYMASAGTKILALPSTLTGSIGVIVGKVSVGGLSQQYGVNWDEITAGKNAAMFGSARGFNADERAVVARSADAVYDTFKSRVAVSRKLSPDVVEGLAQGQVWSGAEAKEKGLVDEIGGLVEAIAAARAELKLAPDAAVNIMPYPDENNPFLFLQLILKQLMITDHTSFITSIMDHFLSAQQPQMLEMPGMRLQY